MAVLVDERDLVVVAREREAPRVVDDAALQPIAHERRGVGQKQRGLVDDEHLLETAERMRDPGGNAQHLAAVGVKRERDTMASRRRVPATIDELTANDPPGIAQE